MVDVDGVIVRCPTGRRWSADLEADLGLDPKALQDQFFTPHFEEVVLGRADLHERLAPVLARIAPHVTSQQLVEYWFRKDAVLDHQLLDDLAEARLRGLALHLATVQEHHRARYLWETLGLRTRFDGIHYAAALGCKKPQPRFFAEVERRTGYAPDEMMLIDDQPGNVEAAQDAGWRAHLWDGSERLSALLARFGIESD